MKGVLETRAIAGSASNVASASVVALVWMLGAGLDAHVQAQAQSASAPRAWAITAGEVRVICPLTIGGSFEAKTTALSGTLAVALSTSALTGELSVDLSTLDTGIALRNQHMRDNYLEVQKGAGFDKAVLSSVDVGSLASGAPEGSRPFSARLRLHGVTQPVSGRASFRARGGGIRVEASFPVRLADYGIADPRYLGVGVGREVTVRVTFVATPVS